MAVPSTGAQGGFVNGTVAVAAGAKTEILANCDRLTTLLVPTNGQKAASPDFADLAKHMSNKILVEITALKAAINAAP